MSGAEVSHKAVGATLQSWCHSVIMPTLGSALLHSETETETIDVFSIRDTDAVISLTTTNKVVTQVVNILPCQQSL